jgi:hypothetical protein
VEISHPTRKCTSITPILLLRMVKRMAVLSRISYCKRKVLRQSARCALGGLAVWLSHGRCSSVLFCLLLRCRPLEQRTGWGVRVSLWAFSCVAATRLVYPDLVWACCWDRSSGRVADCCLAAWSAFCDLETQEHKSRESARFARLVSRPCG